MLGTWMTTRMHKDSWRVAFEELEVRGVETIQLVICDDPFAVRLTCPGMYFDAKVIPSAARLVEQALAHVAPRHRECVAIELGAIIQAGSVDEACAALDEYGCGRWGGTYPSTVALWRGALPDLEPLLALPLPLRRVVLESDGVVHRLQERLIRAVDRHGSFADAAAAESFVGAALARWERRSPPGFPRAMAAGSHGRQRGRLEPWIGTVDCQVAGAHCRRVGR